MRRITIVLAVLMAAALTATAALAASPHFKQGNRPVCTISGTGTTTILVECTGTLSGLGGGDLHVDVTLTGFAVYQCQNPGGNLAPGQNRVLIGPQTTPTVTPASAIKNGNATFDTNSPTVPSLTAPTTATAAEAGCPNSAWSGVHPVLKLTAISLAISQPPGSVFFTCTASNSAGFSDGTVTLDGSSC